MRDASRVGGICNALINSERILGPKEVKDSICNAELFVQHV